MTAAGAPWLGWLVVGSSIVDRTHQMRYPGNLLRSNCTKASKILTWPVQEGEDEMMRAP